MKIHSSELVLYSFVLCAGATAGGWAITSKLAGNAAGYSFLTIGIWILGLMHPLQLVLLSPARSQLFWQIFFRLACGASLFWFLLRLILPVFWMPELSTMLKVGLATSAGVLCVCNLLHSQRRFAQAWASRGQFSFERNYSAPAHAVDWDLVMKPVHLRANLYIPGIPERATTGLLTGAVLFMIAGLNLRSVFPMFSAFAWCIPAILCLAVWMQVAGFAAAQLLKIRELERGLGRTGRIAMCK